MDLNVHFHLDEYAYERGIEYYKGKSYDFCNEWVYGWHEPLDNSVNINLNGIMAFLEANRGDFNFKDFEKVFSMTIEHEWFHRMIAEITGKYNDMPEEYLINYIIGWDDLMREWGL